ncbi:MAG: hypothetical protein Kow0092_08410 [Deferrisomatales bacterium]
MGTSTDHSHRAVVPLAQCSRDSGAEVGGKNANLGEMLCQGFPVPEGFALSVRAYRRAVGPLQAYIGSRLQGLEAADIASIHRASEAIRERIRSAGMPEDLQDEIRHHYGRLSAACAAADTPVAVRSSATAEDLPEASFAGQQDTYLWVRGADRVIQAVVDCWASLYSTRAISYRLKHGFDREEVAIGVGVQQMVDARAAGVMFTLNPLNGDRSKIAIGGSWGLGEGVVGGDVNADEWTVDKVILEISRREIARKTRMHVAVTEDGRDRVVVADVPPDQQDRPCLSDEEILALARLGKAVERHYGTAQDIEWAVDRRLPFPHNIFLLQTRPETVWSNKPAESVFGKADNVAAYVSGFFSHLKG